MPKVEVDGVFAEVEVELVVGHVGEVGGSDLDDGAAVFGEGARYAGAGDDAGEVEDFETGEEVGAVGGGWGDGGVG